MTILDDIISAKTKSIAQDRLAISIDHLCALPGFDRRCVSLKHNLKHSASGIIAEFKRKSPSKGWIHPDADVSAVCKAYEAAGASGISILTDKAFFGGSSQDLLRVRELIQLPLLRKDFILDEYQLYQSKALGADLILLIAAALTPAKTKTLAAKARQLELEVLLEIHNLKELDYMNEYIDLLGVNNRNLKTFVTDLNCSFDLAGQLPGEVIKLSESGISRPDDLLALRQAGYQGFLMGETFMKTVDPAAALSDFIHQLAL